MRSTLLKPDSVYWRVSREAVLLLGGGRALLMQIAHPLVAAGVADHSDFQNDPVGRLRRTVDTMLAVVFGTEEQARAVCTRVNSVHGRVRGRLTEAVGSFAAGTPYDARDPALLFWVHATLVDTAMLVYQRYVRPLSPADRELYYQESKIVARLFGIPEAGIPPDLAAFEHYLKAMIADGPVAIGSVARRLAAAILHPPRAPASAVLLGALNLVTIGLLPPDLREGFGLAWGPARQLVLDASSAAIRTMMPLLPDLLRAMPAARTVERGGAQRAAEPAKG